MKISLSQLKANPYRDMARYPIHREKVEALKASIRALGFWDNVVARKTEDGAHFELAYGHHRLQALLELVNEKVLESDFELDLPVRKLDDAAMLRVMANENMETYRVTADVIDETVRVAREYIHRETKTPLAEITASDISQFLGGSWNESRAAVSLQRLGLFDRGTLRREQLKGLSHSAARSVQSEVGKVEKTLMRNKMARLDEDEEVTEQDRKTIRAQVQKVATHVAQALSDHLRGGGKAVEVREKSLDAQVEMLPEDGSEEERKLSTIDAATQAVNARDFQRKIEMLLRYREHMSADAKHDLAVKLKDVSIWCKEKLAELEA
jgi:hypothetical protein